MVRLISESDKGLKLAFPDIKFSGSKIPPLPTERVLTYLKKNALVIFDEEEVPIYLRTRPEQMKYLEKRIKIAFMKSRKKRMSEIRNKERSGSGVRVPKKFADALRKALREPKK